MIKKILAILSTIGGVFSAIFFVLFKKAKLEKHSKVAEMEAWIAEESAKRAQTESDTQKAIALALSMQEKKNEKKNSVLHANNELDSFNAGIELLREQSEKGQERNRICDC
ncbi:MAG: hypothetical protein J6S67_03280 [Methanobrevibacter sp.]|nr:hypothetical protein [Methanobrevibacter sp.]